MEFGAHLSDRSLAQDLEEMLRCMGCLARRGLGAMVRLWGTRGLASSISGLKAADACMCTEVYQD